MNDVSPELVRATLREKQGAARRTFAVGRRTADEVAIVVRCGWCKEWMSDPPEGAYVESTGICESCASDHFSTTEDKR